MKNFFSIKNNSNSISEKLKESEIRYRRLFETAKDGILILDFETGNILDANPFIIKIIDSTLTEIIGKKLWEIGLFSNKEESELAFTELKTKGYIRFEDMPIQQKNGKITEVEFISNVYLENKKKVIQCNIRNITERKLAECALKTSEKNLKEQNSNYLNLNNEYAIVNKELTNSLNHIQNINKDLIIANKKAMESDKLKASFLANMSHEIRTPMNAILGFSQFLLQPNLTREKTAHFVQIINASSDQLLSVINDIIDISKFENGEIIIHLETVNLDNLLNELFVTYKKIADSKKISLSYSCNCNDQNINIESDGNRIKQILCNLLTNAIKFTSQGYIKFGYEIKENWIQFFVKDTGIGILPENQALIFERFRQIETTNVRLYGGNGLGLSISKALVNKMGGTITVNSELGVGSIFIFTIPYKMAISDTSNSQYAIDQNSYNWSEKTILLVEDELNNHKYMEELLSNTNVKIIHAWDGKEAVEQVRKYANISVVLTDIKMPVMNGYEATRLIKQIRPKLPVIAQTAHALSHDREQALGAGCDNYLAKPIHKDLLMEILNIYLS